MLELTSHGANKKGDFVGKLIDGKARKVKEKEERRACVCVWLGQREREAKGRWLVLFPL